MSATGAPRLLVEQGRPKRRDIRPFWWCFTFAWSLVLLVLVLGNVGAFARDLPRLAGWTLLALAVNLLPLKGWQSAPFAADDPVLVAVSLLFRPAEVAVVVLLGASHPNEFLRRTTLNKTLANHCQLSLAWFVGSLLAHTAVRDPLSSRWLLALSLLVMAGAWVLNYSFVAVSIALDRGYRIGHVVRQMKIGAARDFVITFAAWCVLGAMLVALYERTGTWALLAFLAPILLGRQALRRSQETIDVSAAYKSREQALLQMSKQIDQERADERRLVAADLHDDVLQPLFKVTLMAQVVRDELLANRLTQADDDLLDLKEAAGQAADAVRELVGDLRRPGLGRGGLAPALKRLVELAREQTPTRIEALLQPILLDSAGQLALYQIAKEALGNALHHADAQAVTIELRAEPRVIVLEIRDDGKGFDPEVDQPGHYGLLIMRERASLIRASFYVDTSPGQGCLIRTVMPISTDAKERVEAKDS